MGKLFSKMHEMSDGMKIALWTCACFGFIGLMVLVIVFFVLTPILMAKIALPLSSVLCAFLAVPAVLSFEQILKITGKRDFSKQFSQYKKFAEMSEAVSEKDKEITNLKVSIENYKRAIDDMKLQLDNQMVTPIEIQNIAVEDRHILCTIPIAMEKFYDSKVTQEEIEKVENIDLDKFNWLNIFNPMEDISYRNVIVIQHKAFPQISISYKKIFVENQKDDTLCVYGVIPEVVSKSIEQGEEHIVKFNEMIKMYNRLDKPHAKIVSDEAIFEKMKTENKEKYIGEFNARLSNGIELKAMENLFTAMAQEHIRRFLLRIAPNKNIKFVNRYYDESIDAKSFADFLQEGSHKLISN